MHLIKCLCTGPIRRRVRVSDHRGLCISILCKVKDSLFVKRAQKYGFASLPTYIRNVKQLNNKYALWETPNVKKIYITFLHCSNLMKIAKKCAYKICVGFLHHVIIVHGRTLHLIAEALMLVTHII